ncbi:RsmB/NOP family class I SAM-dependent RNA methyltransferase [Desulfocurvus sp. DL9XJH121]
MARSRRNGHPTPPPARKAALAALHSCLRGSDIQAALDQALNAAGLDPRDAALATELAYGTLRFKARLDWLLARHLPDPEGLPMPMRLALAVAAYEILHLERIPAYASVDWCVEHVKQAINPRLAKVANAVLRRLADLGADADDPAVFSEDGPDRDELLARLHSAPLWLVRLWTEGYGPERAEAYLTASVQAPPLGLRARPGGEDRLGELAGSEDCVLALANGAALAHAPDDLRELLDSGAMVRQSLAGQQALAALGPRQWRGPVWDACAGRGGKSLLLADLGLAPILATDPSKARIRGLSRELRRLGVDSILPVRCRADLGAPATRPFGAVLVDAPCSGLGVISRRPDTKLKRAPEDIDGLVRVQARILDACAATLAPGGTLAYMTCTLNPAENQDQVRAFLERHPGYVLGSEFQTLPDSPLREFFYAASLTAP